MNHHDYTEAEPGWQEGREEEEMDALRRAEEEANRIIADQKRALSKLDKLFIKSGISNADLAGWSNIPGKIVRVDERKTEASDHLIDEALTMALNFGLEAAIVRKRGVTRKDLAMLEDFLCDVSAKLTAARTSLDEPEEDIAF